MFGSFLTVGPALELACSVTADPERDRRLLYFAPVERHVKERLVGAAVLMAAAIILIPGDAVGPGSRLAPDDAGAVARDDAPIKTYTIDLSQSPSAPPTRGRRRQSRTAAGRAGSRREPRSRRLQPTTRRRRSGKA